MSGLAALVMSSAGSDSRHPLSIVVIPLLGGDAVRQTLRSISSSGAPCLVVGGPAPPESSGGDPTPTYIASSRPVPERRAIGLSAVATPWIALVEDTCDLGAGWMAACEEIMAAGDVDGAGGPVALAPDLPPRCMALACLEYGAFTPGRDAAGIAPSVVAADRIAGLALLYRRASLPPSAGSELIETEVNAAILAGGGRLLMHPGLAVEYRGVDLDSATLASRFNHGRIYGGGQRTRLRPLQLAVALLKCIALPAVMYVRALRGLPERCRRPLTTRSWILALGTAWSAGELAGLLVGRGRSVERWR